GQTPDTTAGQAAQTPGTDAAGQTPGTTAAQASGTVGGGQASGTGTGGAAGRAPSPAVGRALTALETLVASGDGLTLTALAKTTAIPLATCASIVYTLEQRGGRHTSGGGTQSLLASDPAAVRARDAAGAQRRPVVRGAAGAAGTR